MKIKKYHSVGTFQKSSNTQIHDRSLSCFGTDTSITHGEVKLVAWAETNYAIGSQFHWRGNQYIVACHRKSLSHSVVSSTPRLGGNLLTFVLVVLINVQLHFVLSSQLLKDIILFDELLQVRFRRSNTLSFESRSYHSNYLVK
jgi:hypothetical protein